MFKHDNLIRYVDLPAQWSNEKEHLMPIIEEVLESGSFINGKNVSVLETSIAKYCSVNHCVTLNSGTDALMASLWALGIKPGDEVITPPNSFIASTSAIVHVGAKPVFVDVLPSQLMDINKIEQLITPKTRAIMPVHLTGMMANMKVINSLAKKHGLFVIEDAAQSIGSKFHGVSSGAYGEIGCFSTHPLKNLNSCGDGGFITTNNSELAKKIQRYRNHGFVKRNETKEFGVVSRMDEIQAAILIYRLRNLDKIIKKRRINAAHYRKLLDQKFVFFPTEESFAFDSMHTFVIQIDRRDELSDFMLHNGVQTAIHYPRPIHLQPAASKLGYKFGDFPATENQADRILTLPVHQYLASSDIVKVCELINSFLAKNLEN